MAQSQLKSDTLEFKNSNSNVGNISYNSSNEFELDRQVVFSAGVQILGQTSGVSLTSDQKVKAYAQMRNTSAKSVNLNSLTPMTFDNVDLSSNITCSASNGTFTVNEKGLYELFLHITGDGVSGNTFAFFGKVNSDALSAANILCIRDSDSNTDNFRSMSGSCLLNLNANDVVSIHCGSSTAGTAPSDNVTIPKYGMYATMKKI